MEGFIELMLWSLGLALATAAAYRVLTNPAEIKRLKESSKEINQRYKKLVKEGKTNEASQIMKENLKNQHRIFSMNMKPMAASFLIFLVPLYLIFPYSYETLSVMPPFDVPFLGISVGWLVWYIIVIFAGNIVFRKLLGVE